MNSGLTIHSFVHPFVRLLASSVFGIDLSDVFDIIHGVKGLEAE